MFKSLKTRFLVILGAFTFVALGVITILSINTIKSTAEVFASSQAVPVVNYAVEHIDGDEYEAFTKSMNENDPYYEKLHRSLLQLKSETGCKYLYTMSKFGNTYKYVVDGSCEPSDTDNFSPLGTEEDLESWGKAPVKAITTGETSSSGFINQEGWGWAISTYRGIKNSSGKIVGIVGCDFSVGNLIENIKKEFAKILVAAFLLLGSGCVILIYLMKMLFGTLNKTSFAMEQISNGTADLTARVPENGGLEVQKLAKNCNNVIASLNKLIANLQKENKVLSQTGSIVKEKMNGHIEQIETAVEKVDSISDGISEQSITIEMISDSMNTVKNEIQVLNEKIYDQNGAIQQSSSAIEEISSTINSVGQIVKKIALEYEKLVQESGNGVKNQEIVNEHISTIASQSKNLTNANQAIAEIARQTNLLAMNAAIEAAHAGEFGKGFGVVADEIRMLAETSSKQSKEVKKLLGTVTDSIQQIVESSQISAQSLLNVGSRITNMDALMKEVENGMSEENMAAKNILSTVQILSNATQSITNASNQMESESQILFDKINTLQKISKQTIQRSTQVSDAMVEMKDTSKATLKATEENQQATDKVVSMITGFKV